jgi:transcriptional regulator with XRE-family HTH domain
LESIASAFLQLTPLSVHATNPAMTPLNKYRLEQGLTLEQLAKKLGVSTSTAGNWCRKPSSIPMYKVAKVAKVTKIAPSEIGANQ